MRPCDSRGTSLAALQRGETERRGLGSGAFQFKFFYALIRTSSLEDLSSSCACQAKTAESRAEAPLA